MNRRLLGFTGLPTLLALGLTGCPGDDSGGAATETDTDAPTSTSTSSTTSSTSSTTDAPTTSSTTDEPTSTSSTSTTDPTGDTDTDTDESSTTDETTGQLACPYTPVEGATVMDFEEVGSGFNSPVLVVGHPVDTDDLYVVQQSGEVVIMAAGENTPGATFLDIPVAGGPGSEQGLFALAFHPDYENDPRIYVSYSSPAASGATAVAEFTVNAGVVDMDSRREIFAVGQPAGNHNGGMIQFGPDDMLYLSLGDGGPQDDACGNGQQLDTYLGKIVRLDPNGDGNADQSTVGCNDGGGQGCNCGGVDGLDYTVPADNPFVDQQGTLPEIYAYGFRNPWRFAFDAVDGRLWVGDVGQNAREEVSIIEAGTNAGWGRMEGFQCNNGGACDDQAAAGTVNADGFTMPIIDYQNTGGGGRCSITGLGVYRSCESPDFAGRYFYADACSAEVFAVDFDGTTVTDHGVINDFGGSIFGGGYNAYGDVFVINGGTILRIVPGA